MLLSKFGFILGFLATGFQFEISRGLLLLFLYKIFFSITFLEKFQKSQKLSASEPFIIL